MTSPKSGPPKALLIGLFTVLVGGAVAGSFVLGRRSGSSGDGGGTVTNLMGDERKGPPSAGASAEGMPEPSMTELEVPGTAAPSALWVDVYRPGKVRDALAANAWLRDQLQKPLGQGFVGAWAAFFGSTGEDLQAGFKGAVLDLFAGQLLDTPFRVTWFGGDARSSTPAFILPNPGRAATSAYDALDGVASRGGMTAQHCPGGGHADAYEMKRWLVAEQTLWAGRLADRLVLARHPVAVLHGLCAELPELKPTDGVDVELGYDADAYGREVQLLSSVLGLAPGTRLQFGVTANQLVPRGIASKLMDGPARLDTAPLSDDLLKLVPEDTPVLLAFQLKLPESLAPETLKEYWEEDGGKGPTRTRQVAMVWTPRGDALMPVELAVLWGSPEDAVALNGLFSQGFNKLVRATHCNHVVLASSEAELERLRKACAGQLPNMLSAAGPVVAGLRQPTSVAFGVNTGRLLSGLTLDGYLSEFRVSRKAPMPSAPPPEIDVARRDLESLPYLGLRGTVQGDSLVPGGFGS
ncbi:hypothetical protein A176_006435 [Myxococcus hansupus]|uniref:Uncharacterized protein n=1 Tax=Pseudomyxococcus hansupus TaxID=1297742 RepID=A0A0H4X6J9_9BACT|nr:hypothetical protein [Myxococcus hansupus]AKQ69523.1 hypothetical protein A176_006435 [Myxococcus hansupus]